jgi:S1-C subfamily serine protease
MESIRIRTLYGITLLLCAAGLLIASERPRSLLAADTYEISFTPSSQAVHADSVPSSPAQPGTPPYQMDQDTNEPEPRGALEYMEASEQVSVFGIEMCVATRKAERDIQGLLVIGIEAGTPGAAAGLRPSVASVPLPQSYDLIIGIDGARVANFADLREGMRLVRRGEIIYFNLLRDGHRMQAPMKVTSAVPSPQTWVR